MKMASPRAASVLLERGNIYFAYRLRVEAQTAHGFDDVQRLYVVLSPRGKASYRLIVIGQKKLPVVAGGGDRMAWGFVEEASSRPEDVEDELDPRRYFTKTRGIRRRPRRPAPASTRDGASPASRAISSCASGDAASSPSTHRTSSITKAPKSSSSGRSAASARSVCGCLFFLMIRRPPRSTPS